MSARGQLKSLPNRDGTVRWVLYFREKGQPDAQVRCSAYNKPEDRPAVEKWADEIRRIRAEQKLVKEEPLTVSKWFPEYYDWRGGETVDDARGRFRKWIEPRIGTVLMSKVTRDMLEQRVSAYLDEQVDAGTIGWKTALNIWGEVTAGFAFATRGRTKDGRKNLSLRCLETNPAESAAGPSKGTTKIKPFLRPDELRKLLSCTRVKLHRRQVYAVAVFTGMRQAELRGLRVRDVDFDAMQISVVRQIKGKIEKQRTKNGRGRVVAIEPNLVPLLRALCEGKTADQRILRMQVGSNHPAEQLRADLLKAGCTREALHVGPDDPMRAPMRFHNLKDTCGVHMVMRGDEPAHIQWRLAHGDLRTTEIYIREAKYQAGPNFGEPLAPIPSELIEGSKDGGIVDGTAIERCGQVADSIEETVEAPGIEPGSENFEATCVYVRIQPFESSRFAPTGELSSGLFTCLISPWPR